MNVINIFDRTFHVTHMWLNDIQDDLNENRKECYHALKAVLQSIRDNLALQESARFSNYLPMLIRGMYYSEWDPSSDSEKDRSKKKFIERVEQCLPSESKLDAEKACMAVFKTLNRNLSKDELKNVREALAKPILSFWPDPEEETQEQQTEDQDKAEDDRHQQDDNKLSGEETSKEIPHPQKKEREMKNKSAQYDYYNENQGARAFETDADYGGAPRGHSEYNQGRYSPEGYNISEPNYGRDDYRAGRNYATARQYGQNYDSAGYYRGRDNDRDLYGTTPLTREYYNDDDRDMSAYERYDYSPNDRTDNRNNHGYGYPGGGPRYSRDEHYRFHARDDHDRDDFGNDGHFRPAHSEQGNYNRYASENPEYEESRQGWNEGRRTMSDNRQRYGYENEAPMRYRKR